MAIITLLFSVSYLLFIAVFIIGFLRKKEFHSTNETAEIPISVIVAFRNEEENLPQLLESLARQTYKHFELIMVNDHSADRSVEIAAQYPHVKLVNAKGEGKKNALNEGMAHCQNELIICTDADCLPHPFWLESIVGFYAKERPDMIIAPVWMTDKGSVFGQMQALEFMSLQASAAGAACAGIPIMCNGANLAFTQRVWQSCQADLRNDQASGDDMFLMMSLKRRKGKIRYLKSPQAVVYTSPGKTLSAFFNQRKRWVSKSPAYPDRTVVLSAMSVFGICLVMLVNLVLGHWFWLATVFLAKFLGDGVLLFIYGKFMKSMRLLLWMLPVSVVYPFYVVMAAALGLFGKFEWKGRAKA